MDTTNTLNLSLFLTILSVSLFGVLSKIPPACNHLECPNYNVIHVGNDFEIRRYNSIVWISTSPIDSASFVDATRIGFMRIFDYIQGKNDYNKKIEMTAPVLTNVLSSSNSSFVVNFYVPKVNQANPPPAKGLNVQRLKTVDAAVRQFGGYVTDLNVGKEVSSLKDSLNGTQWSAAISKSNKGYSVAQYNTPFEFFNRVNEILFFFDNAK